MCPKEKGEDWPKISKFPEICVMSAHKHGRISLTIINPVVRKMVEMMRLIAY